jgi:hydroxymethylglutaryl-CoA reductase (NADPH)
MLGSAMSGSLGFNAHYANIVAAFFAATGQDIAHTVEGSMGITTAKVLKNGDLYFSVYLPAVMLGTVGGGTNLATQKEAISITGAKKSAELAEVLGGAVLAGELSLLSSLEEGSLAKSHQKLGREELI